MAASKTAVACLRLVSRTSMPSSSLSIVSVTVPSSVALASRVGHGPAGVRGTSDCGACSINHRGAHPAPPQLDDFRENGKRNLLRRDRADVEPRRRADRGKSPSIAAFGGQRLAQRCGFAVGPHKGDMARWRRQHCRERNLVAAALGGDDDIALRCNEGREVIAGNEAVSTGELSVILDGCGDRDGKIKPLAEIGQRDRYCARTTDEKLRLRQHRLNEHVHGTLARAHVARELYPPF